MNALSEIKSRFKPLLSKLVEDPTDLLAMIRPAQDGKFGDYQANFAMPLKAKLGKPPRDIANDLIADVKLDDVCRKIEVAGPGFINLTIDENWLKDQLNEAMKSDRLGVPPTTEPKTFVVDFSSPNVAKPMHVGHIRSTVIGDAIARILKFAGHKVITDNHLGDWGTQFGMIIYGVKNFRDDAAYSENPVGELGRLYKLVRKLMDYHSAVANLPETRELLTKQEAALDKLKSAAPTGDKKTDKKNKKDIGRLGEKIVSQREAIESLEIKIGSIESDSDLLKLAKAHPQIAEKVLTETAKLHEGEAENLELWKEVLPHCLADIQRIYDRLGVSFDHVLGESFYHDKLGDVVTDFLAKGFARESEGAICVFMDNYETPMIIQKKDGAFLYATTDLATIKYRIDEWKADAALYVVDHRQGQHFDKLFDAAAMWGFDQAELVHVSFGTVLGDDGKPFKTRSGDTVGLEGLLDESQSRAYVVGTQLNEQKQNEADKLSDEELRSNAITIGVAALKYADLSQNRSSDYKFSYDKMLALKGNTATYLQYSYARVQGIVRKNVADDEALGKWIASAEVQEFEFAEPIERELAVKLLQLGEAVDEVLVEYKPNLLCNYLFELTQTFFKFYDQCSVKKAESDSLKKSRIQLCQLTGNAIRLGLSMLGIDTLDRM